MRGRENRSPETDRWERKDWWGIVLEAPDPHALLVFWSAVLDKPIHHEDDGGGGQPQPRDAGGGDVGEEEHREGRAEVVERRAEHDGAERGRGDAGALRRGRGRGDRFRDVAGHAFILVGHIRPMKG